MTISKVLLRVSINIIPLMLFCIINYSLLYLLGDYFFSLNFDVHIIFFVVAMIIGSFPWLFLCLVILSVTINRNWDIKIIIIEYSIYLILNIIFYLREVL